jgi:mono/diheme cytochrome c family protein
MAAMNEVHDDADHAVDSHGGETGSQDADPDLNDTAGAHGISGEHGDHDSMAAAAAHGIPEEAAAMPNPVAYDAASVETGAEVFAQTCAVCHGPEGAGDGPGAAALEPKPADLRADHVQANSDGGLFYIISEGRAGTAMPAWEETISETQRWHLVNFIRSLVVE